MQNVMEPTPMRQKKGFTGNRYTAAQKRKVTQFVKEYDNQHGRGGIAAAQREFRVSYIALRNWLAGKPKGKRGSNLKPVLNRLAGLKGQVKDLEREIRRLRRGF
jgi:hypothetical protein